MPHNFNFRPTTPGHCHAPSCLSMELYNADTGMLLCRHDPVYGKTHQVNKQTTWWNTQLLSAGVWRAWVRGHPSLSVGHSGGWAYFSCLRGWHLSSWPFSPPLPAGRTVCAHLPPLQRQPDLDQEEHQHQHPLRGDGHVANERRHGHTVTQYKNTTLYHPHYLLGPDTYQCSVWLGTFSWQIWPDL